MDCCARRSYAWRLDTLRHPFLLAVSTLSRNRLDVPRRLRARANVDDSAGRQRWRRCFSSRLDNVSRDDRIESLPGGDGNGGEGFCVWGFPSGGGGFHNGSSCRLPFEKGFLQKKAPCKSKFYSLFLFFCC